MGRPTIDAVLALIQERELRCERSQALRMCVEDANRLRAEILATNDHVLSGWSLARADPPRDMNGSYYLGLRVVVEPGPLRVTS